MRRAALVLGIVACSGCAGGPGGGNEPGERGNVHAIVDAVSSRSLTRVNLAVSAAGVSQDLAYDATTGKFSGTLVLPVGEQRIVATAYAGTASVGSATAVVTVTSTSTTSLQLTILDTSAPPPNPDRGPVITQFLLGRTSVAAGEAIAVSATAVDLDGDAVGFSWTIAPSGCGSFADPTAASTVWTAGGAGACKIQVTASAAGKTDTRSIDVTVAGPSGGVTIDGTFVARPSIVAVALQGAAGECRILRTASDATCRASFVAGGAYAVSIEWEKHPRSASFETSLADTCGGAASFMSLDTGGENDVARYRWTAPASPGACGLTASARFLGLGDAFSVGLLVSGPQAGLYKVAGDRQTAALGAAVAVSPTVRVVDASGNPVGGVTVHFAATAGGGAPWPLDAVSAADGTASTQWTLGTVGANQLIATSGGEARVTFTATAAAAPCAPSDVVAAISPDQLLATVTALTGIERTSYAGQQNAVAYLQARLADLGIPFSRLSYVISGSTWTNLEIALPGRSLGSQIYAAGSHYDAALGFPGADDDASGTAAVVELARVLSGCQLERTVRLLLFFDEEGGTVGSSHYAADVRSRGDDLRGFLNLDMIGWSSADGDFDVVTRPAYEPLATAVVGAGNRWVGTPPARAIIDPSCG